MTTLLTIKKQLTLELVEQRFLNEETKRPEKGGYIWENVGSTDLDINQTNRLGNISHVSIANYVFGKLKDF